MAQQEIEYVSARKAANILGVGPARIYEWIHQGRMKIATRHPILLRLEDVVTPPPLLNGRPPNPNSQRQIATRKRLERQTPGTGA